jgi:hypothetical protein
MPLVLEVLQERLGLRKTLQDERQRYRAQP